MIWKCTLLLYLTLATSISSWCTRLSWMISEDLAQQLVGTLLVQINNGVVQGILVLLEPASDVVGYLFVQKIFPLSPSSLGLAPITCMEPNTYNTGVMANGEVSSSIARLWWFWLLEVGALAQMVVHQLLLKGLISSFGEHRLFLKDGEDTQRL